LGRLRKLLGLVPSYAEIAWAGAVTPRVSERPAPFVYQGVIRSDARVLLSVRSDLRGWELPGGHADLDEPDEAALCREILEETGLQVEVTGHVGDYRRTGFRPHTARVFTCRVVGGDLRPSVETPVVRWFPEDALPQTLFPWYRAPLADALAGRTSVTSSEHQGLAAIWAGLAIDLRMRWSNDRAGRA
jgi:8-oxo-dGTP pyrophosphatase MutT (NUDIX family)